MKALKTLHDLLKQTCAFYSVCATKDNILKKRELFFMAKRKENLGNSGMFSQFASAQNQNIFSEVFFHKHQTAVIQAVDSSQSSVILRD